MSKKEHTKEFWENYFHNELKVKTKVEKEGENWEVMYMDIPEREHNRIQDTFMCVPMGSSKASYALHCLKCDKWFFNGWYQTKCWC